MTRDYSREPELLRLAKSGDRQAMGDLIEMHTPYIWRWLNQHVASWARERHFEDLIQEAKAAMMHAVNLFHDERIGTTRFLTYATWWIKRRVDDYVDRLRTVRFPKELKSKSYRKDSHVSEDTIAAMSLASRPVFSLDMLACDGNYESLDIPASTDEEEQLAEHREIAEQIREALDGLPERTADVLRRRFGIGTHKQSLEQVGEHYGISKERARQIQAHGICLLRANFRAKAIAKSHARVDKSVKWA